MSTFKMNPNFERELKRELNQKVNAVLRRFAPGRIGQPVSEIKPALDRAMRAIGLELPDADLFQWSTKISDGTWR